MTRSTMWEIRGGVRCAELLCGVLGLIVACTENNTAGKPIGTAPERAALQGGSPSTPIISAIAATPPVPTAPRFEFSDKERLMIRQMLADDFAGFAKGWDTMFGRSEAAKGYVVVTADELQSEYERNEVAGDMKYRGKRLALRGKVAEIKRSIGDNYFLHLNGGSTRFMQTLARMADGYVDFLAELEKGRSVELLCEGGGMLMGSSVAADCVPAKVWVEGMVDAKVAEVPALVGSDDMYTQMAVAAVMATDLLNGTSTCFSQTTKLGDATCKVDISRLYEKPKAKKASTPTVSEATRARLKTIPGAEQYLQRMASKQAPVTASTK